jgi:hypothetical protein
MVLTRNQRAAGRKRTKSQVTKRADSQSSEEPVVKLKKLTNGKTKKIIKQASPSDSEESKLSEEPVVKLKKLTNGKTKKIVKQASPSDSEESNYASPSDSKESDIYDESSSINE